MSNDCMNDCTLPPVFPRAIENRAGLPHIDYRIGRYSDIREAMLHALDEADALRAWTYRGQDDPGIALLEGAAVLGDILTFYQELYANEAYIRTARWRESIADLVRLLGYRLSPGLGGNATFAFEIKGDAPVVIPAGLPLKAQLEPIAKPSDFETTADLTAYPWLSRFSLYRPLEEMPVGPGTTEFSIELPDQVPVPTPLKPGDRLLIGEADNPAAPSLLSNAETVIVDSVRDEHGARIVKIKGALKRTTNAASVVAYKLGRTFRHFGNASAPTIPIVPSTVTATSTPGPNSSTVTNVTLPATEQTMETRDLTLATSTTGRTTVSPTLSPTEFALESEVHDLASGLEMIVEARITVAPGSPYDRMYARRIVSLRNEAAIWGTANGKSTIVTLNSQLERVSTAAVNTFDIRQIQLHEVTAERLTLHAWKRETSQASGNVLNFFGTDPQAQNLLGRRLMLARAGSDPVIASVTLVQPTGTDPADRMMLRRVTLDTTVTYAWYSNTAPQVTVYGNIADATEGKHEQDAPLGNGDSRLIFQTFKLPKAPLTYHIAAGETPPETPELTIWVNGTMWERVPTLFGHDYNEQIYIVREDAENQSWVQFGDGKTGARLPSGVANVVARYRTGTGAYGPLKPETSVQPGARVERLDKVRLPGIASGGADPEDGDNARDAAPGRFQSLDRLVSLQDFESETLAIAGVARAFAAWRIDGASPAVVLTVLMRTGRGAELTSVRDAVDSYNRCRGPRRHRVVVLAAQVRFVGIALQVALDPRVRREDVEPRILAALGATSGVGDRSRSDGMFAVRVRRFGEAEYALSVEGAVGRVNGVLWATVTGFASLGTPDDPATITLSATALSNNPAVTCSEQEILGLYSGHLAITYVADAATEGC